MSSTYAATQRCRFGSREYWDMHTTLSIEEELAADDDREKPGSWYESTDTENCRLISPQCRFFEDD